MLRKWTVAGFGLVVVVVLLDRVVLPWYVGLNDEIEVPDVVNMDLTEAERMLQRRELEVTTKLQYEPGKRRNTILNQSPEPHARVKAGRIVHLVVSNDELLVSVPSVVLTTLRDAEFTLESVGLRVGGVAERPTTEYPEGIVIDQSVQPGVKIRAGSTVDLILSEADDTSQVRVPHLVDRSLAEAKVIIADHKLRLGKVEKKYDDQLLPGTVIRQSLDTLAVVPQRTAIDLIVTTANREDR